MLKRAPFAFVLSLGLHLGFLGLLLFWPLSHSPSPYGTTLEMLPVPGAANDSPRAPKPRNAPAPEIGLGHNAAPPAADIVPVEGAGASAGTVGVSDGVVASIKERYRFELRQFLAQNRRYPAKARALGQTGTVEVNFTVLPDGSFTAVSLFSPSPHASLNQEATDLFQRLGKFRPLPPEFGDRLELRLPIVFTLRE